jgi:hypothetical protein
MMLNGAAAEVNKLKGSAAKAGMANY